jgi:hypothetical protein
MRRLLGILLIVTMIASFGGCAKEASSTASPGASVAPPTDTPVPTTPPDNVDASSSAGSGNSDEVTVGDWTYYLDENDAVTADYGEDPPLCRRSKEGTVEDLGLRGFEFDIIGEYIYLDSNYPDLDDKGNQAWCTTRMSLDGSNKKRLEYGSMSARLVPEGAQKFYFTVAGDSAIYVSDFSCQSVAVLLIALPDASDLDNKLASERDMQLDIDEVSGGWITFAVTFLTPEGIQMYKGTYKMQDSGVGIEKIKGTYYDYQSMESELD